MKRISQQNNFIILLKVLTDNRLLFWGSFLVVIMISIGIDFFSAKKKLPTPKKLGHSSGNSKNGMPLKNAILGVGVWIAIALGFGGWIWLSFGKAKSLAFFTGYVVEYSLSVDNLFLFLLIFRAFSLSPTAQAYCLRLGILGALVLRAIMIAMGTALVSRFEWVLYIFGVFLVVVAIKMLFTKKEKEVDPSQHFIFKICKKFIPITNNFHHTKLIVKERNLTKKGYYWAITPLAVALLIVEFTDLVFALDSIPAVFAISTDPLIVYTSNICAILGLRSLFFVLAGVMDRFIYLSTGLAFILLFVGFKMLAAPWIHFSEIFCLLFIAGVLTVTMVASYFKTKITPAT